MLCFQRVLFFRCVGGRYVLYNKQRYHTLQQIGNVTSQCINKYSCNYRKSLGRLHYRYFIQINYVRYLSCSRSYVNLDKVNNDKANVQNDRTGKVNKIVQYYKRLRHIVAVFWNGCKNLYSDVKIALKTRRKLGLFHHHDYSRLTRDEIYHMYQTKADVVKTVPFAFFAMLPFIGYAAPLLAFFYPKYMSPQFWLPDQKKALLLEEYEKRSQYYLPLIKECAVTCKEIKRRELYKLCLHVINGNHPTNNQLLRFKEEFAKFEEFSLEKVPRYHLVKLCKCWLIPTGWYLPRWYMTLCLQKRIRRIHQDDMLILNEGADQLSPKSIAKAVHLRGLDETVLNLSSMIILLDEWIKLSSQVTVRDVSFLAHSAAFKGANFEKIATKNGILSQREDNKG